MQRSMLTTLVLLAVASPALQAQTPPTQPQRPAGPAAQAPLKLAPPVQSPPKEQPKLDLSCMKPELKQIAYATKVSPGESLTLKGCGFGAQPGKVLLKGKFNQGFLKLDVVSWKESEIEARLPQGISGAPDHDPELRIENAAGLPNAEHKTIAFKAERETRVLLKGDFDFVCQSQGYSYGKTDCGTAGGTGVYGVCGASICFGQKYWPSPDPNAFANLNNHPTFNVKLAGLKNGWIVKSHSFEADSGADFFVPPIPVPDRPKLNSGSNGGTDTNFVVKATNNAPTGWYWWKLKVVAEGPKGVPHDKPWTPN
jgi:hypothetical protein